MARSTLSAEIVGDPDAVSVLRDALAPEHAEDFPGVETRLEPFGPDRVRLVLESDRPSQLRAAINAHLRWIRTVEDTLDAGSAEGHAEVNHDA